MQARIDELSPWGAAFVTSRDPECTEAPASMALQGTVMSALTEVQGVESMSKWPLGARLAAVKRPAQSTATKTAARTRRGVRIDDPPRLCSPFPGRLTGLDRTARARPRRRLGDGRAPVRTAPYSLRPGCRMSHLPD